MLAILLACQRSPSNDDSAPGVLTDSTPGSFDPETDLEWHVIDGTDRDCGTAWPLGRPNWKFENNWGEDVASHDSWTIDPSLSRPDVWDASFAMTFYWDEGFHSHSLGVGARWRFQCDRGVWLLLGVLSGSASEWYKPETMRTRRYAASFENPVRIALADSTFEVEGALWYSDGDYVPVDASPATFTGTISDAGTEPIVRNGAPVDATHLVVQTGSVAFVDLFPRNLWLTEAEGLVQFDGPIGDTPSVLAN